MDEPIIPELDYMSIEPTQHAIVQRNYVDIQPVSTTYKTGGDLKFEIPKSEYSTPLHEAILKLKCKVIKGENTACDHAATTDPDDVSVVNNVFHSMWKQCTVSLNGHEAEKIDNYAYLAYVSMLTAYSPDVLQKRGELIGWAKDTAGSFNDKSLATSGDTAGKNSGLISRTTPFKNSNEVELIGRIESDLMNQGRNIPPNTKIEICLTRSAHEFVLMSKKSAPNYKLHITEAKLIVARDKLAPSLHQAQVELIKKYNLSIQYRHAKVVTHSISAGSQGGAVTNAFSSAKYLPDRILGFFVTNKAFCGSYDTNPFEFSHFNMKCITAVVNESTTIPASGYKPNFQGGFFSLEYYSLLREFNADEENFALDLCKNDYANGYTIYAFRIVPRTRGGDLLAPPATGTISINYEFNSALPDVCTLILVGEFRGSFEIREGGDFAPVALVP